MSTLAASANASQLSKRHREEQDVDVTEVDLSAKRRRTTLVAGDNVVNDSSCREQITPIVNTEKPDDDDQVSDDVGVEVSGDDNDNDVQSSASESSSDSEGWPLEQQNFPFDAKHEITRTFHFVSVVLLMTFVLALIGSWSCPGASQTYLEYLADVNFFEIAPYIRPRTFPHIDCHGKAPPQAIRVGPY